MDDIQEYGNEEQLEDQDAGPDLRKRRDDAALEDGQIQELPVEGRQDGAEPGPKRPGIIRLGEEAKYSQGKTQEEKEAAQKELQEALKREQEAVVERNLNAFLAAAQRQAAEGQVLKTIKSLELTLKDKLRVYQTTPAHPALWRITKVLADIALKQAVKQLNNRQFEAAFRHLQQVQRHTEPVAGSNWSKNEEWIVLRKNLHKNFAVYHQKSTKWQQAFDHLKLALRLETSLGLKQDITNTCLTCAIIQQKMKNYGLSIDYAQQTMKNIETELNIKKGGHLHDARYTGRDLEKQKFNDKIMTQYAISMHILGKNLLNLNFHKEAKHFITKAHHVVTKMLVLEKKTDLQMAIQLDMKAVLEKTRYMEAVTATDDAAKEKEPGAKRKGKKDLALTDEDVERSLAAIKSGLATVGDGQDTVQERYKEIEQEIKELNAEGELGFAQFQEEFRDIVETKDGRIVERDEQLEDKEGQEQTKKTNEDLGGLAQPDEREQEPEPAQKKGVVKKQVLLRGEDQADKRETDPEYMQKLDEYKSAQEKLKLRQDAFNKRQQEYEDKKAKKREEQARRFEILEEQRERFLTKKAGEQKQKEALEHRKQAAVTEAKAKLLAPAPSKQQRHQSEQRTKKAPVNLAKLGAQQDVRGVVHVGEKGTKQFFKQRKKHILSLNREQYHSHDDKVKLDVDEYQELLREKQDADVPGRPPPRKATEQKESGKLPPIGSHDGPLTLDLTNKKQGAGAPTPKAKAAKSKLFDTGLRSTSLVVDRVKDRVYQPPKASSLVSKRRAGARSYKEIEAETNQKVTALEKEADRLKRSLHGEDPEEEEEERRKAQFDAISEDVDALQIGPEGQEVLNEETRNYLTQHKTHQQLQEEDPEYRRAGLWGYDERGNKVLLRKTDAAEAVEQGEEEEMDAMAGVQKLTAGMKAQTAMEDQNKHEIGKELLETEVDTRNRKIREREEEERRQVDEARGKATFEEAGPGPRKTSILKSKGQTGTSQAKKRSLRREVHYDERGIEQKAKRADVVPKRGRQASGQKDSQQMAGKPQYAAPGKARTRKARHEDEDQRRKDAQDELERKANTKHDARSYYGLDKPTQKEKERAAAEDGGSADPQSLGYTQYNKGRLEELARPVDKEVHKLMHDLKERMPDPDGKKAATDKQVKIAEKLQQKRGIDFKEYIDRDVAPISGVTGEFSTSTKTSKGLRAFDTKTNNKKGTFAALVSEHTHVPYALQAQKERFAQAAVTDGRYGHKQLRQTDGHLPEYMKVARQVQLEKQQPDNAARTKAYRKAMNDNVVQQLGLKNHIPFAAPQYLNMRDLRALEDRSAQQIQSMIRGFFARKWYLNYIVRKKLGVPFSGLEFAQNPFLRQFNKPNTYLTQLSRLNQGNVLTAVPTVADVKLSTAQIKRLKNKRQENALKIQGNTKLPDRTDAAREAAKKLRKGRKPHEIIQDLQDDFLAQGLDAYEQFKRLNVGIDHDEQGQPHRRVVEDGQEIKEPLIDPEAPAEDEVYGVFQLPNWLGDRTDKGGGLVDTSENEAYVARKRGEKERKQRMAGQGPSLAALTNHIVTQEPMAHRKPGGDGGDGGPDGGPGGGAGSPSALEGEGGDREGGIRAVIRRARDPDGEDAFFQPQRYQQFSREPIIFYKRVVNDAKMLRWTIKAGEAFKRRKNKAIKYFLPISLLGQVLGSYQIVYYKMNLELIKIPDSITQQLENFPFETVWPFILYLFNYWVKNQANLMMKSGNHPHSAIYATELRRINSQQRFIEFFHESAEFQEELRRRARMESIEASMLGDGQLAGPAALNGRARAHGADQAASGDANLQQYDNLLDFSSEIEYDERFDAEREKFKEQFQTVGNVTEGQRRIEKSMPGDRRANTKQQRQQNRQQLLDIYKRSVEEYEKAKKRVTFEQAAIADDYEKDPEKAERELRQEQEVKRRVEAEKYMVNIQDFINENYLHLPANTTDSKYKLLAALQSRDYHEFQKKEGLAHKTMALLNEERRRRLKLPPLTAVDYNSIERAAQKLKLVIDCLMLTRRMSGYSLISKDIVVTQMLKQQDKRAQRHRDRAKKQNKISLQLYQQWGVHEEVEQQFNINNVKVQESLKKIGEYQRQHHMLPPLEDGPADNIAQVIQQHLDVDDMQMGALPAAAPGGPRPGVPVLAQQHYDHDMAELDDLFGGVPAAANQPAPMMDEEEAAAPTSRAPESDAFAARHARILNEFENYLEDKVIVDQQVVRLPEEESNSETLLFLQSVYARKIKSNVENILQILWQREAEKEKAADLQNRIFTGDRAVDEEMLEEEEGEDGAGEKRPQRLDPLLIQVGNDAADGAKEANNKRRKELLEKAPKITRLQSKVCAIMSDHEDVLGYDAQEYPPGTSKISKFLTLDVEQEKLQKQRTTFKTYAEVQICSSINRKQMWDDSVNIPWEAFMEFFAIFGLAWDPVQFLKRGHFRREEAFLISQYFSRCFYLDHDKAHQLSIDLNRLCFKRVQHDEIFLTLPENLPAATIEIDELTGRVKEDQSAEVERLRKSRKLFVKYITNDRLFVRFDDTEYDKLIYPFYDEAPQTYDKLFKRGAGDQYIEWIEKFRDPEEQKEIAGLVARVDQGALATERPRYMVAEAAMQAVRDDPHQMFNLTLSKFNNREQDLLYLGRLQLGSVIKFSKVEPYKRKQKTNYNVKIEYFVRGEMPCLTIRAFDCYSTDVLHYQTINKKNIKMLIRICNQQSDKMIINQLESLVQVRTSKLTVGRSLFLNFGRRRAQHRNLSQAFVNMLICNEKLLQKFITNQAAVRNQELNNGVKQFKGILRNFGARPLEGLSSIGHNASFLVNINQYDMRVETLLYYDPMTMIHGNKHLQAVKIKDAVLDPIQRRNESAKVFDRVKIWKVNLLDMTTSQANNIMLSLHDIVHFYESELPLVVDLDNQVQMPNLIDLLFDYLSMVVSHRSVLGRILLWKVPQYKRPTDPKTGRWLALDPDSLYRMKILDVYKQMLHNVQQQLAQEDNNALPMSLDADKKNPDKDRLKLPSLCLRCKTVREKNMPIFENNSRHLLKVFSQDMHVIVQRPKVFAGLKRLQYALVTVVSHPSMECWIWQLYFPKTQRTFTVTLYSSDLFALDDNVLDDEYILASEDRTTALWAHLINLSRLVKNPIGDIMLQIETYKEPLREILFQDIVYNQNARDLMFMEVVLKNHANYVTDVDGTFPAIELTPEKLKEHTFAVRAYSLTRNVWIKDFQPLFEVVAMLRRENYYVDEMQYFYYTMLKDTACLLSHKIIFSDEATATEVKRRRLVYDIKSIIGRKKTFGQVASSIERTGSPKKEPRADMEQEDETGLAQATGTTEPVKVRTLKHRQDWQNVQQLNRIIYQAVLSQNPVQMCTINYNEVKDVFVYRMYRAIDSSIFERQITSTDVIRTCAPHLRAMMKQGLHYEVGQRVAQHYMSNILVASVLEFYKIR